MGFPHSSVGKESACNAGDPGSIPGLGRSPGEGNGNPPQYSWLENPMDTGAWQAIVYGISRVGHDLATKPPFKPPPYITYSIFGVIIGTSAGHLRGFGGGCPDCPSRGPVSWDSVSLNCVIQPVAT